MKKLRSFISYYEVPGRSTSEKGEEVGHLAAHFESLARKARRLWPEIGPAIVAQRESKGLLEPDPDSGEEEPRWPEQGVHDPNTDC